MWCRPGIVLVLVGVGERAHREHLVRIGSHCDASEVMVLLFLFLLFDMVVLVVLNPDRGLRQRMMDDVR